ncbi:MAG: hypothetical protein GX333_01880 [Syntrophomonadaceae bacterium]|nr:hypothetical protein [Syntrophomonadaceae bacterium]
MYKIIRQPKVFKKLVYQNSTGNKSLDYIKATMLYEDLDLPTDLLKIVSDNINDKITNQEAGSKILKKYGLA